MTVESSTPARTRAVERFHRLCDRAVAGLPCRLNSLVAPTFLGFCLINSFTFGIDLVLLYLLHGVGHLSVPIAVTVAYACAFATSYVLNRIFNFSSHAPVGSQFAIYVVGVAVNYLAFILGVSSLLSVLGVDYRLARLAAGVCEAMYMYSMMRWVVFRK